jgi:uncharacterized membrane protein YedE/YeeE
MKALFAAFGSGLVFALGLGISGMTRPVKVIGFLDFFGAWDASLAFVMIGGIAVYFVAYRWRARMTAPLLATEFALPKRADLDYRLIVGAVIFGAGWGLGGFCPGPAITSVVSGAPAVLVFVAAMVAGMYLYGWLSGLSATAANWKVVAASGAQDA